MKRDLETELLLWKTAPNRYPLLLRGARQVGKTHLVETFGLSEYKQLALINFEQEPKAKECFLSLDPVKIVNSLQALMGIAINEETLLFLDEIQECPQAIMALRYFREQLPNQPVIAAGSLLEFALRQEDLRMPVGRVQYLYMNPLSFREYLISSNEYLAQYLLSVDLEHPLDDVIHKELLTKVREYLLVGGMPAVVKEYLGGKNIVTCQRIQSSIHQTFRGDFGKYSSQAIYKYLDKVYTSIPLMIGQQIKYSRIDPDAKSRDLKNALDLLQLANIISPIKETPASGIPLGAQFNDRKFKACFLDVGLVQNACRLEADVILKKDIMQINAGAIAEQFVGQELMAYEDCYQPRQLFYWARDKTGSSAEVDYLMSYNQYILPIEVKSGHTGTLRSMRAFVEEKNAPFGIRISPHPLECSDGVLNVPLYMIGQLRRLVSALLTV